MRSQGQQLVKNFEAGVGRTGGPASFGSSQAVSTRGTEGGGMSGAKGQGPGRGKQLG